ncbi:hypothetical protein N1851_023098 [Merluccius polli]|uniref:Reverse transcriptase domain-containing protein n=1 Tax=Merluccius polli TaxID=89951 RepID=A0AA47MH49_MERPO|nr:hypothetical protein N1851_023098 [Merluccius polli]
MAQKMTMEATEGGMEEELPAEGCFIPKEENSTEIKQLCTISLLNMEGKIFFGILARRLTTFMLDDYMDTSVQKGGVPGVPGCLEHTSVISKIIKDAKRNHGDLTVLWLDLTNAYGTIPHKLVERTLKTYHKLLQCYFDKLNMCFTCGNFTTDWQVGIVTGCTISVILFSVATNLAVLASIQQVPIRAFMDDLTITAKSVPEGRWILEDLVKLTDWARMEFKPAKSRSLILRRGRIREGIQEKLAKSLGKWYRADINDKAYTYLTGKYKVWGYQHGVFPRLLWPLLVYEVPVSTVEGLERKMNTYLRRWLDLLLHWHSTGNKLQLPVISVVEEHKETKTRQAMMLRDSQDASVCQADMEIRGMNAGVRNSEMWSDCRRWGRGDQ